MSAYNPALGENYYSEARAALTQDMISGLTHPSAAFSPQEWHEVIGEFLEYNS